MTRFLWLIIVFGLAAPARAQTDVVAHVKSDLLARGVNLSGTCGAFEVTKRVGWLLRAQGWGYVQKSSGDQCNGFSGDKLVSSTGRFVDLLIDQGGANTPAWQERPATPDEIALRADPTDPGDGLSPVPPPVVSPPPPVIDVPAMIARLNQLADAIGMVQQTDHEQFAQVLAGIAQTQTDVADVKTSIKPWKDLGTFLLKYVAPEVAAFLAAWKLAHP